MVENSSTAGLKRRTVLAAAALAAPAIWSTAARAANALSIRVDLSPWGAHAALHLANQQGLFKKAGIAVDIQDGTGTLNTINLVGAGQVDVGFVQLGPMAIARQHGVPVKSISGFIRKGDLAVMVDAKTGPRSVSELAGKTLACFSASPWAPFVDPYLKKCGLSRGTGPGQVNVEMVSPAAMAAGYAAGRVDGFMSLEPYGVPLVQATRPARAFLAVDQGIQFPSYGLIATDSTIGAKANILRAVNETQAWAWSAMAQDPAMLKQAVAAIIAARPNTKLNPDVLYGQAKLCLDFLNTPNTQGKKPGWQSQTDWTLACTSMADAGVIPAGVAPHDFYTNDLVQA